MKTVGNILLGLLFIIVLAIGAVIVLFKFYPAKATALFLPKVSNIRLTGTSMKRGQMHMLVKADLSSKIIPFFLDSMSYQTVLYRDTITRGKKNFENSPDSGNTISLPMTVNYKTLVNKMKGHEGDSTLMGFAGQAYLTLPILGTRRIDIYKELPIRMLVFPEIKLDKINIEKIGLNNSRMKVKLKIHNPNYMAFSINELKYKMNVKNYLTSHGVMTNEYHVKAFQTSDVELIIKSDLDKPVEAVWNGIKGKKFSYTVDLDMNIKPENKNFESMDFNTVVEGNISKDDLKGKM